MRQRTKVTTATLAAVSALSLSLALTGAPAQAGPRATAKTPTAVGGGGAVATVDPEATRVGLDVLRKGGNAVDAAVAAAATLGVTEPYSAGIGGGGFFVYYDATSEQVHTIDGRETAPAAMGPGAFDGMTFNDAVTSGLSAGVPGTPATWQAALDQWGTLSLKEALKGGRQVASRGFVVDATFRDQTAANEDRFNDFTSTRELFLPGGQPPAVGSIFSNRDLAATYQRLGTEGVDWLYDGELATDIVDTVAHPPVAPDANRTVRPGLMTTADLAVYAAPLREPTHVDYRGLDIYGMGPPSSGGSTVGEALNILDNVELATMTRTQALHHYFEASALAYADRGAYLGDPGSMTVSLDEILSQPFADERYCEIDTASAMPKPTPPGEPDGSYDTDCDGTDDEAGSTADREGPSTTHLTVADQWGNVVSYTLTIESTGGNGIVVPDRGFLLNNELTDFNFSDGPADDNHPNAPGPGKRPRSSMAPTIVLDDGAPFLALGSPGGSTIITTVLQTLINRLDLGMTLPEAIAEPRANQRNTPTVQFEPAFDPTQKAALTALGHVFGASATPDIGAATAIEFLADGRLLAAAEPVRRGGGSAGVVSP